MKVWFTMSELIDLLRKKSTTFFSYHIGLAAPFLLTNYSRISHNVFQLNTLKNQLHT